MMDRTAAKKGTFLWKTQKRALGFALEQIAARSTIRALFAGMRCCLTYEGENLSVGVKQTGAADVVPYAMLSTL